MLMGYMERTDAVESGERDAPRPLMIFKLIPPKNIGKLPTAVLRLPRQRSASCHSQTLGFALTAHTRWTPQAIYVAVNAAGQSSWARVQLPRRLLLIPCSATNT